MQEPYRFGAVEIFTVERSLANLADHALVLGNKRKAVELGRELLRRVPERRNYHLLVVRGNLANALLQSGELEEAREVIAAFHESSRAAQWDAFATFADDFPLLAACEGRIESAARLLGYVDRCNESLGGEAEPNEKRAYQLALGSIDARMDVATRDRLAAEGKSLDHEAVCALTLEPVAAGSRRTAPSVA